ncbi:MAG: hypothetical protein M3P49_06045 [Actinomycetota bacterium]|nr:hypothetical protein [Actinomycetota bacterium]
MIPPIIDLPDPYQRLAAYRAQRADEEERRMVADALAKDPAERTEGERAVVAYSPHGTAAGCGCRG